MSHVCKSPKLFLIEGDQSNSIRKSQIMSKNRVNMKTISSMKKKMMFGDTQQHAHIENKVLQRRVQC